MRLAQSGAALPSPRLISTTIAHNESEPENRASLLTMQWGQFLDHDIALTPSVKAGEKLHTTVLYNTPFVY